MTKSERAAYADGWLQWFGIWWHSRPWEAYEFYRPPYFVGTAQELCLAHGLETGDRL